MAGYLDENCKTDEELINRIILKVYDNGNTCYTFNFSGINFIKDKDRRKRVFEIIKFQKLMNAESIFDVTPNEVTKEVVECGGYLAWLKIQSNIEKERETVLRKKRKKEKYEYRNSKWGLFFQWATFLIAIASFILSLYNLLV